MAVIWKYQSNYCLVFCSFCKHTCPLLPITLHCNKIYLFYLLMYYFCFYSLYLLCWLHLTSCFCLQSLGWMDTQKPVSTGTLQWVTTAPPWWAVSWSLAPSSTVRMMTMPAGELLAILYNNNNSISCLKKTLIVLLLCRLSSSTEQSTSSHLMRRHKRRRRRQKVAKMDRVSLFIRFWITQRVQRIDIWQLANLVVSFTSLRLSAASQTPLWAWTLSQSHWTWVRSL